MDAYAFPLLIKQLLVTPIAQRSRKEIVYRDRVRFGYPQLVQRIGRLGSALSKLGVGFGSTVGVLDWDSNRYLESYFAVPMLGATLMKTNVRLSPEQIAYTLDHSEAETLLVNVDFMSLVQQILPQLPRVKRIICLSDDGMKPQGLDWVGEYEALLADGDPAHEFPDFDENTRATLYYTTGTTGAPKGVFFSHRQLVLHCLTVLATVSQAAENGRFTRNDVYMPLTPMFHAHAWGYPYIATLGGWKQVYPGRYEPSMLVKLVKTEGVTYSHCVPTVLGMVLGAPEAQDADFGGWKVLIGGSALSRTLCEAALSRNIDIYCGYGMSESCPLLTLAQIKSDTIDALQGSERIDREIDIRMTPGMPILLAQVRIVDEQMQPVPADVRSVGIGHVHFAQPLFIQLADAGLGNLVDKFVPLWHSIWRDCSTSGASHQILAKCLGSELHAWSQNDHCQRPLTPLRVDDTDYCDLLHGRVLCDQVFDFDRRYPFATAFNDVFLAVQKMQVTLFIEATDVAGVHPATVPELRARLLVLKVALSEIRGPHNDFTSGVAMVKTSPAPKSTPQLLRPWGTNGQPRLG